ncbi:MAG: carboxylesterase [Steroidobacteraceae bacterium]
MTLPFARYRQHETESEVVLEPASAPRATVIWLHGLGADGFDFVPLVPELALPDTLAVRFVFPHAPVRPVTVNNGYAMRAWYDIKVLSSSALAGPGMEDAAGIRASGEQVSACIDAQVETGIDARKVILAGFSQGGAVVLQAGLRHGARLGGILALSTYLPLRDVVAQEVSAANRDVPILMCHGSADPMVPLALGERSREVLQGLGYPVDWRTYPMQHQVCAQEIADISEWLQARLQ